MLRLTHMFRCWVARDRIRVSPREGRLLRLSPGMYVCLHGNGYEVVSREADGDSNGAILYRCIGVDDQMQLRLTFDDAGSIHATIDRGSSWEAISIDAIESFG